MMLTSMAAAALIVNSMSPTESPPPPPVADRFAAACASNGRAVLFAPVAPTEPLAVDLVIPVHTQQAALAASIAPMHAYLASTFPAAWPITIAHNASPDTTLPAACQVP